MNIVLIGYRASGKSTIGRLVAARLSMNFVDIDHEILARFNRESVAAIWDEFGEAPYRSTECDVTELACQQDGQVIALGGGTPMEQRAFEAIASATETYRFYLRAPADVLYERSLADTGNQANRPSLTDSSDGLSEVKQMLARREPTYLALATHTIDVASQSFTECADEIAAIVSHPGSPR